MMSPHLWILLPTLSKLYISSIQPRSLFIFSAKVITSQSCGEHQKQCMNSLQASLNEKEIQWPCKKKCASSTQNFLFFLWRENFWSTEAWRIKSAQYSIQQTMFCFNTRFELYRCSTNFMSSTFWLLGDASRDFSHAEKERTACKAQQIHKMTTLLILWQL